MNARVYPHGSPHLGKNRYRRNVRAADLRANDLQPVCPHCGEYNAETDVRCQECGTHLTERRMRAPSAPMIAARTGEAVSPDVRAEASGRG